MAYRSTEAKTRACEEMRLRLTRAKELARNSEGERRLAAAGVRDRSNNSWRYRSWARQAKKAFALELLDRKKYLLSHRGNMRALRLMGVEQALELGVGKVEVDYDGGEVDDYSSVA